VLTAITGALLSGGMSHWRSEDQFLVFEKADVT